MGLNATHYKLRFNLDTPKKLHWKVAGTDWALAPITVDCILNYVRQIKKYINSKNFLFCLDKE